MRGQYLGRVAVRLADVENHRLIKAIGHLKLRLKHGALNVPRREIIVIVQPDFTQRDGLFIGHAALNARGDSVVPAGRVVRVNASRGIHPVILPRQIKHGLRLLRAIAHKQRALHAIFLHPRDGLRAILVKALVGQVAMRIEQSHAFPFSTRSSGSISLAVMSDAPFSIASRTSASVSAQ